jgi:hypothetical protein
MDARRRVRIICDECGDDHLTEKFIQQMADGIGVDIDKVHAMIIDGEILLEGCHAIRAVE